MGVTGMMATARHCLISIVSFVLHTTNAALCIYTRILIINLICKAQNLVFLETQLMLS